MSRVREKYECKCGKTASVGSLGWVMMTAPPFSALCPECVYGEDYYLRGKQVGLSLYENYRWLPDLTIPMARAMVRHLGIMPHQSVLDFGCARGYLVRALRECGRLAYGYDPSTWAIENADPEIRTYVTNCKSILETSFDWIIAKDVLEHVPDVAAVIDELFSKVIAGMLVVVPLSATDGLGYVVPEYEADATHIHRLTLSSWVRLFARPGWAVTSQYAIRGIKDNYAHFPRGNGFITVRRLP
jgi:SAM-dependent methyltransferase